MNEEKFKFTKLIPSICFLIVGIALVINQNFLNEVCKLAGYFFIFAAVVCLILYFAKKSVDGQRQGKFAVFTVLLLIGGVFLEILPVFLEFLIPIFIGLTLLADGFYGMSNSFAARTFGNKWIAGFILSAITVVLGVLIIVKYKYFMASLQWFIGASFIAASVFDIITKLCYKKS